MRNYRYFAVSVIFFLFYTGADNLLCQGRPEVRREINQYFESIRNQQNPDVKIFSLVTGDQSGYAVSQVAVHLADSLPYIRGRAIQLLHHIGLRGEGADVTQMVTGLLINTLRDNDSGIVGAVLNYLSEYPVTAYNETAIGELKGMVHDISYYQDRLVKLYGYLGFKDMVPEIQQLMTNHSGNRLVRWSCHLALARLGVESEVEFIVERARGIPVNDRSVYNLFPDLVYVSQPETIDYLVEVLFSEEENCSSANPDMSGSINCAYRVMELLAPVVENFPLEVAASGDILTDDYIKALEITREWFRENREGFVVRRDGF